MPMHQPRLAEMVAEVLRDRIVSGELEDGAMLPRQEDLLREFDVSRPSLRETLRILESEGLITVHRGSRGGATVHLPRVSNAAYAVGLVLQSRAVQLTDVRDALMSIEPVCAGLCAGREDRAAEVLPALTALHEESLRVVDDAVAFSAVTRQFHEAIVEHCGNETLKLIVGALESLWWSSREEAWAHWAEEAGAAPDAEARTAGIQAHTRLLQHIESGDLDLAQREARLHLDASLFSAVGDHTVVSVSPRTR